MKTFVALLRGVNVSGHNIIKMATLKSVFEELGYSSIKTYLQSGNIVFQSDETNTDMIRDNIQHIIFQQLHLQVPTLVLDSKSWSNIINQNPFKEYFDIDLSFIYVTILSKEVHQSDIEMLVPKLNGQEKIAYRNNVIYLYAPEGYSKTKLNNNYIENKLHTTATTRNWKTISAIHKIVLDLQP